MSEYWDRLTAVTEETKKLKQKDKEASKFADSVLSDIKNNEKETDD